MLTTGLPTIYHMFAEHVPPEQRSRAFGYLAAFGSIGQVVAAAVFIYFNTTHYLLHTVGLSPYFIGLSAFPVAVWVLFVWFPRYTVVCFMAKNVQRSRSHFTRTEFTLC